MRKRISVRGNDSLKGKDTEIVTCGEFHRKGAKEALLGEDMDHISEIYPCQEVRVYIRKYI